MTARVEQPQAGAATPQPTMAGIPDPLAPATPAPQPAQSGLFAAIPDPTQPAAPGGRERSGSRGRKPR